MQDARIEEGRFARTGSAAQEKRLRSRTAPAGIGGLLGHEPDSISWAHIRAQAAEFADRQDRSVRSGRRQGGVDTRAVRQTHIGQRPLLVDLAVGAPKEYWR
jgi:hypothetical protein